MLAVVGDEQYPRVMCGEGSKHLDEGERRAFCTALGRQPPFMQQKFENLVSDFGLVIRREQTGDTLMEYLAVQ